MPNNETNYIEAIVTMRITDDEPQVNNIAKNSGNAILTFNSRYNLRIETRLIFT